ncbi:MAG TPA: peptidylprolyl isomerase [Anaerolineales bacterium]|nr:peptidylprolyl isomerase [Anaerolineales bacterium]
MSVRRPLVFLIGIWVFLIWLSACNKINPVPTLTPTVLEASATTFVSPEPSRTPIPPSATPEPLAAIINNEAITLSEFQAELARYQASITITGTILASDTYTIVLDELIDQTLLAQAAAENGYIVDDTLVQTRIKALEDNIGGAQALQAWQSANGYTDEDFTKALKRSIGAAWMRDQIIATVPETAEQVHISQIIVPTAADAEQAYSRLQSGEDFLEVVIDYDPVTKGDLGWFPRGYLSDEKIDEAAFALQPGQYSQVIQNDVGYHILYMLERDPARTLQPEARRAMQKMALQGWISERRNQSNIQILVP